MASNDAELSRIRLRSSKLASTALERVVGDAQVMRRAGARLRDLLALLREIAAIAARRVLGQLLAVAISLERALLVGAIVGAQQVRGPRLRRRDVLQDGIELRHVLRVDFCNRRVLRVHEEGEQRRMHGEVFARRTRILRGAAHELAEMRVDHLGGMERRRKADEVARKHAVDEEAELIGLEPEPCLGERGLDLPFGADDVGTVLLDAPLASPRCRRRGSQPCP